MQHSCVHARRRKGASCLGAAAKRQHGHVLFRGPDAGVSRSLISVGPLSHRMTEQLEPCGTETILLSCLLSSPLLSPPLTSSHLVLSLCTLVPELSTRRKTAAVANQPTLFPLRSVQQTCRDISPRVFKVFQPQRNMTLRLCMRRQSFPRKPLFPPEPLELC